MASLLVILVAVAVIVIVVLGVLIIFGVGIYNKIVSQRNRTMNAWSQIDVQLKRRHDLIPNLVNSVQGYMQHERGVFEAVSNARQKAISAGSDVAARSQAENNLTQALRSLFAVAEAYPELKANQNMLSLQEELSSTENKVAFSRQFYNDAVLEYNTTIQSVPYNLFAGIFGFKPAAQYVVEDAAERAVPQVQFQNPANGS
jgi:LemA protein